MRNRTGYRLFHQYLTFSVPRPHSSLTRTLKVKLFQEKSRMSMAMAITTATLVAPTSARTEEAGRLYKQDRFREVLRILHLTNHSDCSTYASLLQGCVNKKALTEGKLIHSHMSQNGLNCQDIFLGTKLAIMYAKCGVPVDARNVFDQMCQRNVVSWTVMISSYARHGHDEEALTLFYQMQRTGIQPNQFTFASVLPACANLPALEHGKEVHEEIIRGGFRSNVFVENALVDMYMKCGSIEDARNVFDKMLQRDVISWNTMIAGYAQNGHFEEALKMFDKMPKRNVVSWNGVIAGFAHNGYIDKALELFQKMPERNVVSWTVMIAGYAHSGRVDEALKLFLKMPERDTVSWTTMIAGYVHNGFVNEALKLFQKMPERDVVSWNAMISGYVQTGHFEESLELFLQMQLTDVKPNSDTFASVLSACANLAVLKHGKEIHGHINRNGFQSDMFVGNALVDMYAKCGSIEDACHVFEKMPRRNVVSWTAMIAGCAMHGRGKEALQLFEQMQHSGAKPNHVTFIGVLSACCHAGLVDAGWQYFDSMSQYYHITPAMEHYCCMVDLLGRAGLLEEAQDFIMKMPIKPDAVVWRSLLGACRIHANVELGERVAEHLFELDPKYVAPYVLLSNIYAAAGKWDDIQKVRKMMKDRGVKWKPGCSWIEINKQVHTFLVGDRSHS
eukprot:Gb_14850 [translate_table: standard]